MHVMRRPGPDWWLSHAARLNLKRSGGESVGPCPACGGTDRFHVHVAGPQAGVFGCRQCNDFKTILQAAGAPGWREGGRGPAPGLTDRERRARRERGTAPAIEDASPSRLWQAAAVADPADVERVCAYLARRGYWPARWSGEMPANCRAVRPEVVRRVSRKHGPPPDAVVCIAWRFAAPGADQARAAAVELEALTAGGRRCRDGGRSWRRTLGSKRGAPFIAGAGGPSLAVVEGSMDALLVSGIVGVEAWAAGSTTELQHLAGLLDADPRPVTGWPDGGDRQGQGLLAMGRLQRRVAGMAMQFTGCRDPAEYLACRLSERAAIVEHDAGLPRPDAERTAWEMMSTGGKRDDDQTAN